MCVCIMSCAVPSHYRIDRFSVAAGYMGSEGRFGTAGYLMDYEPMINSLVSCFCPEFLRFEIGLELKMIFLILCQKSVLIPDNGAHDYTSVFISRPTLDHFRGLVTRFCILPPYI